MEDNQEQDNNQSPPLGQIIFDNFFLFFMLSLVISLVFYNLWGLMELLNLPIAGQ